MAGLGDPQARGSEADDAFEEFVRARSTHLFRLALVLTGYHQAAAEDVLQIALERAYRRRRQLFRHGSAEPYVRKVVVNAAIDWQRARRRRAELPLDMATELAGADLTSQVTDRDVLVRALAGLAPKQRAVLVMRYWEDVPDAEIAAALNCSAPSFDVLAAVRRRHRRLLRRLAVAVPVAVTVLVATAVILSSRHPQPGHHLPEGAATKPGRQKSECAGLPRRRQATR